LTQLGGLGESLLHDSVIMSHTTAHKIVRGAVRVLHIKLTILAFILLPIAVFTLITSKTDRIAGIQSFVVLTGSMTPNIPQGSVIFTKKAQAYSEGDVIAFNSNGRNITHRIAKVENLNGDTYFQTKGDANNVADSDLVSINNIVGRSQLHLPYIGKVILFLKTIQGFMAMIVAPSLIFIGMELWAIKKEIERETEKKVLRRISEQQVSSVVVS